MRRRRILVSTTSATVAGAFVLAGCGAGSRIAEENSVEVPCDIGNSSASVNVLAYNSPAIDPFTNTMVRSCSKGDASLNHEPIDFAGQVQKTTATLSSDKGTYDILETYGFVLPELASKKKLRPLDDLMAKYRSKYDLDQISPIMKQGMTVDGKLYALPMQAQMFVTGYRKDVFDKVGVKPPTTFAELRSVARTLQTKGGIRYPLALPWLASADIVTAYDSVLGALGTNLTDPKAMTANLDSASSKRALREMRSLLPFMNPEVTTYDQPAVQQQMYRGAAVMSIMFSGRMNDLSLPGNSRFAKQFAFAPPPAVTQGGTLFNTVSIDGWSIPENASTNPDTLFRMMAASISPKASKHAMPAAYPAREGLATSDSSPYADAANRSITSVSPAEPYPWTSQISIAITPIVAEVMLGKVSVDKGAARMQAAATKVLSEYKK